MTIATEKMNSKREIIFFNFQLLYFTVYFMDTHKILGSN
jgi:hypothetical protein